MDLCVTEARKYLFSLIDEVPGYHESIENQGKRVSAVLLSEQDWRAIQETLYLTSIPGMRESILEGMATPADAMNEELGW
uniref:type II toxin-antitoxin system Phd/YefM family antitoxin n=1 Tax=Synechococcus sp. UW106 TaxID=368495 RepID=UPI000E0E3EDF|nr:type II toxin-antitoxin system Phd/YefM family antitoxin [Synechococcus sp. UW106]